MEGIPSAKPKTDVMERIIVADYDGKSIDNNFQSVFEAKKYFAKEYGIAFDEWVEEYRPYFGNTYTTNRNGKTAHFAVVF